jgi:hypothetical protein
MEEEIAETPLEEPTENSTPEDDVQEATND